MRAPESDGQLLSKTEMFDVIERCIKLSKADEIEINLNSSVTGNTRFAANQLSTSGAGNDVTLVVYSAYGPKHAVVTTNDLSQESLQRQIIRREDRKSTRLNSSHSAKSRMPSSA